MGMTKTKLHIHRPFSAVIPAAGKSERMGSDKILLPDNQGSTFARHLVNCFGVYGCNPVVLVVNEGFDPTHFREAKLAVVLNHNLERGRSWSILLGLKHVPEGNSCFIQNIDNPYLEPGLLDILLASLAPHAYAVPVCRGKGGHPILLGYEVVDFLRWQQDLPDFRLGLQSFTRIEVPFTDERILLNINTPGEYREFIQRNRKSIE